MADPAKHPFRWEYLDQRLLSPQLEELSAEMQKRSGEAEQKAQSETRQSGNSARYLPRLFELQQELANEWAQRTYDIHREVWRTQGQSISADFIRALRDKVIPELIASRKGAVRERVQVWCMRTRKPQGAAKLGQWTRMMNSLAAKWVRNLEAEAAASDYRASQEIPQRAAADDLLSLPTGLQSSGDPTDGNPFPISDPRHSVWDDATREAEEQWCRINSEPGDTYGDRPDVLIDSVCSRIAGKFDIWAKRGVHVVWSDEAVRAYDQWLIKYAEAWLQDVSDRKLYSRVVPLRDLLAALRLFLSRRVAWWKAEARRYVAEQKGQIQSTAKDGEGAKQRASVIENEKQYLSRFSDEKLVELYGELETAMLDALSNVDATPHDRWRTTSNKFDLSAVIEALSDAACDGPAGREQQAKRVVWDELQRRAGSPEHRDFYILKAAERLHRELAEEADVEKTQDVSDVSLGKPGPAPKLSSEFVHSAGKLWREAMRGQTKVTHEQLKQIALRLDTEGFKPPSDYLEKHCAQELRAFNSRNSTSKAVRPIKTWNQLVANYDKDRLRGMRKLLSRCAEKLSADGK